jgi:hypothetical protein
MLFLERTQNTMDDGMQAKSGQEISVSWPLFAIWATVIDGDSRIS